MLLSHERSLQPGLVGAGVIVPVAGLVGSRDTHPSSSTEHPATAPAEETGLQCRGLSDLCWAVSRRNFCAQIARWSFHAGKTHSGASGRIGFSNYGPGSNRLINLVFLTTLVSENMIYFR